MKKIFFILFTILICSCSKLVLPDNWKELNAKALENVTFKNEVGTIDPNQYWNVAKGYGEVSTDSLLLTPIPELATIPEISTKAVVENIIVPFNAINAGCYQATSAFTVTLMAVHGTATYELGVYYHTVHGSDVEQKLWDNFTGDWTLYPRLDVHIPINISLYDHPTVFGFYLVTKSGSVTKKYYSECSRNSGDTNFHNKFYHGLDGYYIYFEDGFGTAQFNDIKIKLTDALVTPSEIRPLDFDKGPWMLICEDYGSECDNDFNDVILVVNRPEATKAEIELVAAGAVRRNVIYCGTKEIGEIHELFGVPEYTMVNTGQTTRPTYKTTITVDKDWSMSSDDMGGFRIISMDEVGIGFDYSRKGTAPYMIVLPANDFKWPKEQISIFEAYPKFINWAKDKTKDKDWYKYPDISKVY